MLRIVVGPVWRIAIGDRAIRFVAEGPVDVAIRKAPGDDEAHLAALARGDADTGGESAVLGLLAHVLAAPRLGIVPLRQGAGLGEIFPVNGEVVEPLAAVVVVGV